MIFLNNIKINNYLTKKQIDSFTAINEKKAIQDKIILLLSYKPRSRFEIIQRLENNKFNSDFIKDVILKMEKKGYINDKIFAETYAKYLITVKMFGRLSVYSKLSMHKISRDLIESVIDKLYNKYKPSRTIEAILNKKKYHISLPYKEKQKIFRFIKQKGFLWDEISGVLEDIDFSN